MIKSQVRKVLVLFISFSILAPSAGNPTTLSMAENRVSTSLYGSVTLLCRFTFVHSLDGLTTIWDKEEKGRRKILYWIREGKEDLEEQDPGYRGRVELSAEITQGDLSLTLKNISYEDEGTYSCRAANKYDNGDMEVTLSIAGLDAEEPAVTLVTTDGKQRLKCMGSGVYRNPKVQWNTTDGEDLSDYGSLRVTEQSNGRMLVESVLEYDVDTDVWCHVMEGRLRKSAKSLLPGQEETEEKYVLGTIIYAVVGLIIIIIGIKLCSELRKRDRNPKYLTQSSCSILGAADSKYDEDYEHRIPLPVQEIKSACLIGNQKLHTEKAFQILNIKDEEVYLKMNSQGEPQKSWIIQRGSFRIEDGKNGDFGRYIAEVHPPKGGIETITV